MQPLNAAIAERSEYSRRSASDLIKAGRVKVNRATAHIGQKVPKDAQIAIDGHNLPAVDLLYYAFNKPVGYECSKQPEGTHPSMYDLLPNEIQHLNYAGRLDVDSHGLVLLTNDGAWLQKMTHPRNEVARVYEARLHKPLNLKDKENIVNGINIKDGISKLELKGNGKDWTVTMREGRNRQIRKTFAHLGYEVVDLQRIQHGPYKLNSIAQGECKELSLQG